MVLRAGHLAPNKLRLSGGNPLNVSVDTTFRACSKSVFRLCSENASTCFESSAVDVVVVAVDRRAASKTDRKLSRPGRLPSRRADAARRELSTSVLTSIVSLLRLRSYDADSRSDKGWLCLPLGPLSSFGATCTCTLLPKQIVWLRFD